MTFIFNTLNQGSATGGPRAACGPWTISVRPASLRSVRKKYQSKRPYKFTRIYTAMLLGHKSILESSLPRGVIKMYLFHFLRTVMLCIVSTENKYLLYLFNSWQFLQKYMPEHINTNKCGPH